MLKPRGNRIERVRFIACLLVIPVFLAAGCSGGKSASEQVSAPVPVAVKTIEKTDVEKVISVTGNIEGLRTARLGFLVAGKVNYIAAREGETVRAGQLLASLDPESYRIGKELADAAVAQIEDEHRRLTLMHERKSLSDGDYAKINSGLRQARAQQRLQAKNLADTRLYTPFSGILLKRGVEVGEIIGTGMPVFAVSDIHVVKVNASVPETDLQFIRMGSEARVRISSLDSEYAGKVVEIGSLAEATTRAFPVKIEVGNPDLLMRPGMTADIRIQSGKKTEIMAVPGEAVMRDPDNAAYVFVVDENRKQAFKRRISLGEIRENGIAVTSGLAPGEQVVVGGQHKLNDGTPVTVKQAP
ncbi:MAG TPA: efflux RND transporter periplasmic adaptor subunit [Syntrophales bacterium]|nr:efflux RND transporter periplasmic adaptor subunit [Syntrophales bacterium]